MVAPLSKFILNTDYGSIKEGYSFDLSLNVSDTIVQAGDVVSRHMDISVPEGVYFENVTMSLSSTGETSPTPFIVFIRSLGEYEFYQIVADLVKIDSSTYRLQAGIQNMSGSTQTIPSFSVNVKVHLFVSSF